MIKMTATKAVIENNLRRYVELIKGFRAAERGPNPEQIRDFVTCIEGYRKVVDEAARVESLNIYRFNNLLTQWQKVFEAHMLYIRANALDLNVFKVIGFSRDEVSHSQTLAWLFDKAETHHVGERFFKLFLRESGLPEAWASFDYIVKTESSGQESRIDIRIYYPRVFVIDIEVKVNAGLGIDQLSRESNDVLRFAHGIGASDIRGYLLTIAGDIPENSGIFIPFTWRSVSHLVSLLNDDAGLPVKLSYFLSDYRDVLLTFR